MEKTGSPLHPPSSAESEGKSGVRPRALDLFCGAGGATKGLQRAGFHVTGVDNRPQPRYCGDVFHQADALTFPLAYSEFIGLQVIGLPVQSRDGSGDDVQGPQADQEKR